MSVIIASIVFLVTVVIGALYAFYVRKVSEGKTVVSVLCDSLIHALTTLTVISYTKNSLYVIHPLLGSFVSTYLVMKYLK